jgi:AMP nucleosidase
MGSPNAATMMDLLSAIMPKAVLFLGKCGGLKRKNQLGDLCCRSRRSAAEGTFRRLHVAEVPALPAFALQRAVSTMIRDIGHDYWTGTVYTTNRRVWEHDEAFKERLRAMRCMAIDMETATCSPPASPIASRAARCCWCRPADDARRREDRSRRTRSEREFVERHIQIGIEALRLIRRHGK